MEDRATLRISSQHMEPAAPRSRAQPSGYTEPLLHGWRLKVKAA